MGFRVQYEVTPDNAPRFAADAVRLSEEVFHMRLDYSVESLKVVNGALAMLRLHGADGDEYGAYIFSLGCYVGEVFVRQASGWWIPTAGSSMEELAGAPLVIELPGGRHANPIDKVFKRFHDGAGDDVHFFYHAILAMK